MAITETKDIAYAKGLRADNPQEWNTTTNMPVEWTLDAYTPVEAGPWPAAILLHGAGEARRAYTWMAFARKLAEQGVRVYAVDYPDYQPPDANRDEGLGYREMADAVTCAVRYVRSQAGASHGMPARIVLAGFSLGGGAAAQVAVAGDTLDSRWEELAAAGGPPRQVACEVNEGPGQVDALVGFAGAYDVFLGFDGYYDEAFRQKNNPAMWKMFTSFIGENRDLKVRLLHGEKDETIPFDNSVAAQAIFSGAGYDSELVVFKGYHEVPVNLAVQTIMSVLVGQAP